MLGAGARRGARVLLNSGRNAMSRRVANQHKRALAMSVALSHNVSLANIAPGAGLVSSEFMNFLGHVSMEYAKAGRQPTMIFTFFAITPALVNIFVPNFQEMLRGSRF